MVSKKEMLSRMRDFFSFSKQERSNLALAIVIFAFIFSFRDWGEETFSLSQGLQHFVIAGVIIALSIFVRISCQKWYALSQGYSAEFRVWWTGILISLVLCFLSFGYAPLVLLGGMTSIFMTRQRLGEFRYGHSYWQSGMISLWALYASLILAILFALGQFAFPDSYFFAKGVLFNLLMGICAILPLPALEGLHIFFAARWLLIYALGLWLLAAVLLFTKSAPGLIIAIGGATLIALGYLITGSEK